ncbi:MAG: hypothetical protein ACP5E3_16990, partial [Bacteroidales bacterium]
MRSQIILFSLFVALVIPGKGFSQSAELTGTIFTNNDESDVRAGGQTIDIQLSSAFWAFDLGQDNNESTKGLIEGFTGNQNWDVVKAAMDYTNIVRRSGTSVRITLPEVPSYYLSADETITLTIPPVSMVLTYVSIDAKPEIIIQNEAASVSVSGSIQDGSTDTEVDIRSASSTIILTLSGDVWNSNIGSNNPTNAALVNGITGSASWNDNVVTSILGSDNGASRVSRSGSVVTNNVPASPGYNIIANDNISINVPNQALDYTASGTITGVPGLIVYPAAGAATINDPGLTESTLDGAQLTLTLQEAEFKNPTLAVSNFTHNGPSVISIDAVTYVNRTQARITLGLNGDL